MALPKATVQLQAPTAPLGSTFASSTPSMATEDEEEEEGSNVVTNVLSIVGFVAALVVLSFQIMTANVWVSAKDNAKSGEWSQLMD
jgi:hypothetical protein